MNEYATPEICRVPLAEVCLKVKLLATKTTIEEFLQKAIDSPSKEQIACAISLLKNINALDSHENMTDLGSHLAHMPIDCLLGKAILYALFLRCLDPVLTIVSALSLRDPFLLPIASNRDGVDKIKREFSENSLSDHKMLYHTYQQWQSATNKDQFCADNSISNNNMKMIEDVRVVLMRHLKKMAYVCEESDAGDHYNDNALNWTIIKACITAGLYREYFSIKFKIHHHRSFVSHLFAANVCKFDFEDLKVKAHLKVEPHISSILYQNQDVNAVGAEWIVYSEKCSVPGHTLIRNCSLVSNLHLVLFSSSMIVHEPSQAPAFEIWKLEDWMLFSIDTCDADLLRELRSRISNLFLKFLKALKLTDEEDRLLQILISVVEEDPIEKKIKKIRAKALNENK